MTLPPLDSDARTRWHCRRGMLELDLLLLAFFDKQYAALSADEKRLFQTLLTYPDPDLFSWLMGHAIAPSLELDTMVKCIRNVRNNHDSN